MANKLNFEIGFEMDKQSIEQVKKALQSLQNVTQKQYQNLHPEKSIQEVNQELAKMQQLTKDVSGVFDKAFNAKLGTLNAATLNQELRKIGGTSTELYNEFAKFGSAGQSAFQRIATTALTTNTHLRETKTVLDKIGETLGNTIKWNIASAAINQLSGSIQEAYGYVKALDHSLNDIRIVTGKSSEEMDTFAEKANNAAKALGTSTTNYTKSALTFYQQGLEDKDVQARAELSNKVSNVTGLSGDQSAEYVTAVLNGYKVGSEEAEHAMDKLAAVAASTASDLAELSEGMSKVASAANAMGVTEDQLAATLSTVVSTTRQSASSVGTAFKTIYARIADIKAGADGAEATLGEYSGKMAELGFNVLDSSGQLKDLGVVMEDIGNKWANLSREQQVSLAKTMAGTRQYNNLIALFDNWGDYMDALNVSMSSNGAIQEQQNVYMESTAAHLKQLKAANEDLFDSFLDADTVNSTADAFSSLIENLTSFIDALGGGKETLLALGSIATQVFSKQITKGIINTTKHFKDLKASEADVREGFQTADWFKRADINDERFKADLDDLIQKKTKILSIEEFLSEEEKNHVDQLIEEKALLSEQKRLLENTRNAAQSSIEKGFLTRIGDATVDSGDVEYPYLKSFNPLNNAEEYAEEVSVVMDKVITKTKISKTAFNSLDAALVTLQESYRKAGKAGVNGNKEIAESIKLLETEWDTYRTDFKKVLNLLDQTKNKDGKFANQVTANLNNAMKAMTESNFQTPEKAKIVLKQLVNAYEQAFAEIKQNAQDVNSAMENEIAGSIDEVKSKIKGLDDFLDGIGNRAEKINLLNGVVQTVGAIGQLTSALQTFFNIFNIWSNENLTSGEKVLQIIEASISATTMLIMAISTLGSALPVLGAGLKATAVSMNLFTAAEIKNVSTLFVLKTTIRALIPQLMTFLGLIAPWVSILAAVSGGIFVLTKMWNASADAVKNAHAVVDGLTTAYGKLNEKVEKFKQLSSNYEESKNALISLKKGTDEYVETLDKANESARELIDTYNLYDKASIKDGLITIDPEALEEVEVQNRVAKNALLKDIAMAKRTAAEADIQNEKVHFKRELEVNSITDDSNLHLSFSQERIDKAISLLQDSQDFSDGKFESFIEDLKKNGFNEAEIQALEKNIDSLNKLTQSIDKANDEKAFYDKDILNKEIASRYAADLTNYDENTRDQISRAISGVLLNKDDGSFSKNLDEIKKAQVNSNAGLNAALAKFNSDLKIENDEDLARKYAKLILGLAEEEIDTLSYIKGNGRGGLKDAQGNEVIGTDTDDKMMRKAIYQKIASESYAAIAGSDADEIKEIIQKLEEQKKNNLNSNTINGLLEAMSNGNMESFNFSNYLATLSPEQKNKISKLNPQELLDTLGLSDADLEILGFTGDKAAKKFHDAWMQGMENYSSENWINNTINTSDKVTNQVESVFSDFYKGDLTAQNESYQELKETVSNLVEQYPKLLEDVQLVNNEALIGTQEWAQALHNIQATLADQKLDAMFIGLNEEIDKLSNIEINNGSLEEFQEQLDKVFNQQYAINIEIHAQAKDMFQETEDAMRHIEAEASKIGENMIVKAEDLYELNRAIPGILESRRQLADGTIQLDREVVANAMQAAQEEVQANKEATVKKLRMKQNELLANVKVYKNIRNIAVKAKKGTISDAKAKKQITEQLDKVKETSSSNEEKMNKYIADSGTEAAKVIGANFGKAYQSAAESAVKFAQTAAEAHQSAKTGKNVTKQRNFKVNITGDKYTSPERQELQDLRDVVDSVSSDDQWQTIVDEMDSLINGMGNSVSDIEGMIAEIEAVGNSTNTALNGIGLGRGSGKGGGSKNQPDHMDYLRETIDKFHDINRQIKILEHNLNLLEKESKKLTGKNLLSNLEDQLKVLEQQKKAYRDKIDLIKKEASLLRESLSKQGVTFDSNGYVSNYTEILEKKLKNLNNLITKYNGLSANEQKQFKDKVNTAKKEYEFFKKQLNEYNKMMEDDLPAAQEKLQEQIDKQIETQIQKFDLSLQVKLDISTVERQWNDFVHKTRDDLEEHGSSAIAEWKYKDILTYYNANKTGTGNIQEESKHVNTILSELKKMDNGEWSEIYGDNKKHAIDDLKKHYEALMKDLTTIKDLEKAIKEEFLKSIDAVEGSFDSQRDAYHFLEEQLQHDMKLIELLYGKEAYDKMSQYYDKQLQGTKNMLAMEQRTRDYWKEKMLSERAKIAAGTGDKEALSKYENNWKKAVGNINKLIENWANQTTEKYENTIKQIIENLNNEITNGLGLDYVDEELSLINKNAKNYLDDINAAYAKQKLANKWKDAIDNTDSVSAQQELNKLMEEQNKMLEEKGKLTQYDIDRAEKEYEIALKQIALKEAQQNKSTMRLKRDANGNYSYQFVSDEDEIRKAQDDLDVAKNNLYNFDKEAYQQNLNEVYATWNEFQQKLQEVNIKYANDEEERQKRLQLLKEEYGERLNFLTEQNLNIRKNLTESAFAELSNLYKVDIAEFQNMTEEQKNLILEELVPQWDSGVQQMIDKIAAEGGFKEACMDAFDNLHKAAEDYQSDMEDIKQSNQDASDQAVQQGEILLEQSNQLIDAMKDEMQRIAEVMGQVDALRNSYLDAKNAALDATEAAYNYIQAADKLMRKKAEVANYQPPKRTSDSNKHYYSSNNYGGISGVNSFANSGAGGINGSSSGSHANKPSKKDKESHSHTSRPSWILPPGGYKPKPSKPSDRLIPPGISAEEWFNKWKKKERFASGGYTGSWGSNGKLGILDEKELVLNKTDTKNILSAVDILRNIVHNINEKTSNKILGLLSNCNISTPETITDKLEQQVYITANFEGQTEADQITTALDNLVNIAAQRANHKK